MIIVINGSPKPGGNTQRMLEKIAGDTGLDYEILNLFELKISPCTGCVKCARTNRCVQSDDMLPLYDKIVAADALILGSAVFFGHANAATLTFLERLFPLRHVEPQTTGKFAATVCVGGDEGEQSVKQLSYQLESYFNYNVIGEIFFNSATPPCFTCGFGTTCRYGGPARWMSPEDFENFNEITPEMFQNFEDHPAVVTACERLSRQLKQAVAGLPKRS
jgi:multimeric flavodoxin WrbA